MRLTLAAATAAICMATSSFAATLQAVFDATPVFIQDAGAPGDPNTSVEFTVSDNFDGTIGLTVTNIGDTHIVGTSYVSGLIAEDFVADNAFTTKPQNRYQQFFGEGVLFSRLNLRAGESYSISTAFSSNLGLDDFVDLTVGFTNVERRTSNLSLFGGTFMDQQLAQQRLAPAPSPVPLPAGIVLLGSGLAMLAFGRKQRA